MKTIKRLLAPSEKSLWIAFLWTLLVFYLSFKTPSEIPKFDFFLADKLIHFSFYFGFVFLWYHYMCFKKRVSWKDKLNLVIISVFMGILIEFCQGYFTTNRQADVFDALANTIGSLCGIATAGFLFKKMSH